MVAVPSAVFLDIHMMTCSGGQALFLTVACKETFLFLLWVTQQMRILFRPVLSSMHEQEAVPGYKAGHQDSGLSVARASTSLQHRHTCHPTLQ